MENSTMDNGTAPDELSPRLTGAKIAEIVFCSCIFCIGLPLNCLAVIGLYNLVKANNAQPIYVINLLIADLLQLATLPFTILTFYYFQSIEIIAGLSILIIVYGLSIFVSIGFFVCISLERYVAVVHPLWHQSHRSPRFAIKVSVGVWLFPLLFCIAVTLVLFLLDLRENLPAIGSLLIFVFFFLVPLTLLVFFYVRSKAAITSSIGAPDVKKKRALRVLSAVLVLFIVVYGPFFTLSVINAFLISMGIVTSVGLSLMSVVIRNLSVIVDPILYVFLRNDEHRD
uniref:G-protein coupled receptors family 1 profile domain-containing protein n=1 Tax=Lepisosteus oculatus TaxID=7918 RepID=W5LY18_LEPOC